MKIRKILLTRKGDAAAAYRNAGSTAARKNGGTGPKRIDGAGRGGGVTGSGSGSAGFGSSAGRIGGSGIAGSRGSGSGSVGSVGSVGSAGAGFRGVPGGYTGGGLYVNAPVILGLTLVSALILIGDGLTGGLVNYTLMSRFTSWIDPLMYMRFFTRVLAHADFAHYFANFMLILVVGPLMEEKYGAKRLLIMLATTAFTTGLFNALLFPEIATIGASGLAFMLILLSSFVNVKNGGIPLTMVLVSVFYIGNEVLSGLFVTDNISQFSHIAGGLCGAAYGFYFRGR